jgi:hypothetical protein
MISFDFCGSQGQASCSDYFLENSYNYIENATNLTSFTGVKYLKSWVFSLVSGVNNLNVTENETYSMGSMLYVSSNEIQLGLTKVTNYSNADYVFGQRLSKIRPNESSSYYRLNVKALTTRYIYNLTNGFVSRTFNSSGIYSMVFNVTPTNTAFSRKKYTVNVSPGKIIILVISI